MSTYLLLVHEIGQYTIVMLDSQNNGSGSLLVTSKKFVD
jgi:hypothetical protein